MAKYFRIAEFECSCGCRENGIKLPFIDTLDKIRGEMSGMALVITSGYRCPKHNAEVGGKKNSSHLKGLAADISCTTSRMRFMILKAAINNGVARIGIAKDFIHLDMDPGLPALVAWLY